MIVFMLALSITPSFYVNAQKIENRKWIKFDTGVITVVIPSQHVMPIYFWWYDKEPDKVYVAHYYGLAEAWLPPSMRFRHKYMFNQSEDLSNQIMKRFGGGSAKEINELMNGFMELQVLAKSGKYNELIDKLNETIHHINELNISNEEFNETLKNIKGDLSTMMNITREYISIYKEIDILKRNLTETSQKLSNIDIKHIFNGYLIKIGNNMLSLNSTIGDIVKGKDVFHEAKGKIHNMTLFLNLTTGTELDNETIVLRKILVEMNSTINEIINSNPVKKIAKVKELMDEYRNFTTTYVDFEHSYKEWEIDMRNRMVSLKTALNKYLNNEIGESEIRALLNNTLVIYAEVRLPLKDMQMKIDEVKNLIGNKLLPLIDEVGRTKNALSSVKKKMSISVDNTKRDADELKNKAIKHFGKIVNRIGDISRRIEKSILKMHPPFLPFAECNWKFKGPMNITDSNGKVIGVEFSFILSKGPRMVFVPLHGMRGWSFLREGDIIIRNRMYYVPVNETVNNQTYTVTRAELKNDIIINHWVWNYDIFNASLGNLTHYIPTLKPKLILISRFTLGSYKPSEFGKIVKGMYGRIGIPMSGNVEVGHGKIKISSRMSVNREFEYDMSGTKAIRYPEIIIKSSNSTVAGFYKFLPYATIKCNGTVKRVNVTGVFLMTNKHLTVFLAYPYFNNCSLEHDPSMGVVISISESPQYTITYENGVPVQVESTHPTTTKPSGPSKPAQGVFSQLSNIWIMMAIIVVIIIIVGVAIFLRRS